MKHEITSLNLDDLDIEELENRLQVASVAAEDLWGCTGDCDNCSGMECCINKPATT